MKTKHAPFSLYKKSVGTRRYWYVRYWDPRLRAYTVHRATGIEVYGRRERKSEAEKAANDMLAEVCFSATYMTLVNYLKAFWDRGSPYFQELALVRKREVSGYYIAAAGAMIRLHVAPYPPFSSMKLEELTAGILRDFMLWLARRGVSGSRINRVLQVIRVPLRYAVSRDEAVTDPFTKITPAAVTVKEKGVLTREEIVALVSAPVKNARERLAVLLGLLCGMRLGEVRGLCWEDAENGVIHLNHNWQDMDGLKRPKFDSWRDVPLPRAAAAVLSAVHQERGCPASGLVFAREKDARPLSNGFFRLAMNRELAAIGISGTWMSRKKKPAGYVNEQSERNLTFHSLRHTFVTLSRLSGINDFQVQALAGHKSAQMMHRYSHPRQMVEIDDCRRKLEEFSGTSGGI
jgi:integrase